MYIVQSLVKVPVEKAEEVIGIYQNRSKLVDAYEGFKSFHLWQNEKRPEELTVHMEWESKETYLKWATSEAFKKVHDLEKNYPDQELAAITPKVTKFKVVAT
ncbi:antibiotic biosynthesis monooxygenase family protein [Paenisporosarcina cavernae]|uniref:Antibiotic biosynthesis monooxygenase n=1 Tax=Paenisporosarcina cavernae TaxID=2320858 RepID=A0A385YUU7_9BACL|nr:antibiotic biosynthesis monooxygenase [Paenisporosarcina cavernae]AYC30665.1 antibiotic biosynthesis monooxygenase [Paenisporosarcina cavernae]